MGQNLFSGVMQDNLSGSGKILAQVQQELLSIPPGEKVSVSSLLGRLSKLENRFPHFALLFHFLENFRNFLKDKESLTGNELAVFVWRYQEKWENTQQKAAENLLGQLSLSGKTVLLHSNSSSLQVLFRELKKRAVFPAVWQTVSSPAGEGLRQAEALQELGFTVSVFHEDAIGKFIGHIDLLLLGSDLIWDNAFLNKTGSLPLALVFQHFGKPVYVLAEKRKQISRESVKAERFKQFLQENPKPEEEIFPSRNENIAVYNYYFEAIPLSLITRLFTEE